MIFLGCGGGTDQWALDVCGSHVVGDFGKFERGGTGGAAPSRPVPLYPANHLGRPYRLMFSFIRPIYIHCSARTPPHSLQVYFAPLETCTSWDDLLLYCVEAGEHAADLGGCGLPWHGGWMSAISLQRQRCPASPVLLLLKVCHPVFSVHSLMLCLSRSFPHTVAFVEIFSDPASITS